MESVNVVYLDDEQDLCDIFRESFESPRIKITTYTKPEAILGSEALTGCDLLFIDFRLPSTTGDEVALRLPGGIKKFLLTGDIEPKVKYCFEEVLSKPFNFEKIQSILDHALAQKTK